MCRTEYEFYFIFGSFKNILGQLKVRKYYIFVLLKSAQNRIGYSIFVLFVHQMLRKCLQNLLLISIDVWIKTYAVVDIPLMRTSVVTPMFPLSPIQMIIR